MSYDAVFGSFELDMIALESAVQLYEVSNDIDDEYLSNDVSYDAVETAEASESVTDTDDSSFAFGIDLFETTVAMESEGSDGSDSANSTDTKKKESFGSKLKGGIKSILGNIGKFFSGLATRIKEIGAKISAKIKEMATKAAIKKEDKLRNAVLKEAQAVRKSFQQAVNVLDNTIKTDATEVNKICDKINAAINAAKDDKGNIEANVDNLSKVGSNYGDDADKDTEDIRKRVENCKKAEALLAKHIDGVSAAFDQLCVKMAKLRIQADSNKRRSESERVDGSADTTKKVQDRNKAIADQNDAAVKSFKEDHKDANISSPTSSTTGVTKDMIKHILITEEYTQKTNISALQSECDKVSDTCSKNATFCSKAAQIVEGNISSDNKAAKRAFNLCKLYMEASGVFTKISAHITQLSTGSIFGSGSDSSDSARKFKDE